MASARPQIIVAQPARPSRRARAGRIIRRVGRAARKGAGMTVARLKEKQQSRTLLIGGGTALAFGLIQRNVKLPGIKGLPNSLLYGASGVALGLLAKSDVIVKASTGPLFAGLHNIGKNFPDADTISGTVAGEFEDVAAGDFDDLNQ